MISVLLLLTLLATTTRSEMDTNGDDLDPTVMIVLLARNKGHVLPHTLGLLDKLDYPRNRISLFVRSDHNEDETGTILKDWLANNNKSQEYHSVDYEIIVDGPPRQHDQVQGPLEWTPERFYHIMALKEEALNRARNMWADWIWFLDCDVFIVNPSTLKDMTSMSQLTVVAPMLTTIGLYSNFWAGMTENHYYRRTDEYQPILGRKNKGCHVVPMVHSAQLVNLNRKESKKLTFLPHNIPDYQGPADDIIVFAMSAQLNKVDMYVCNVDLYGYIMLPLDDDSALENDLDNLSNLKILMYSYGHMLPDEEKKKNEDKLGVDNVYMINLDRRKDRRVNMFAIFDELNVQFEWVKAVDGKKDVNEEYIQENHIEMMPDFSEPYHSRPLTFGEIGCFMSHYNVWKDVLDKGYNEVIVLEDDIRFEPFFKPKLRDLQAEVANLDWDLIFLGRKILHNVKEDWVEGSSRLVHVNYTYWTLGYMLNKRGAEKLVSQEPLSKMVPVDEYLPIMYDRHPNATWKRHYYPRDLKAFSVQPLLLYPTHYTGEEGYISDTEDTPTIAIETESWNHLLKEEL